MPCWVGATARCSYPGVDGLRGSRAVLTRSSELPAHVFGRNVINTVTQQVSQDGTKVIIAVIGRFDFGLYQVFRNAYRNLPGIGVEYCVNLNRTDYVDSSALGMLLLLREHAGEDKARVILEAPSPTVRRVLEIANFQKLFVIK